jgi:hypothetical protein
VYSKSIVPSPVRRFPRRADRAIGPAADRPGCYHWDGRTLAQITAEMNRRFPDGIVRIRVAEP